MDDNSNNRIKTILVQALVPIGFTQEEVDKKAEELIKKMNTAVINSIYSQLTPDEQDKLKKELNNINDKNSLNMAQSIRNICQISFNKLDPDKIADKSRERIFQQFWSELNSSLNDEQKSKIIEVLNKHKA